MMLADDLHEVNIDLTNARDAVLMSIGDLSMFLHFTVMLNTGASPVKFRLNSPVSSLITLPPVAAPADPLNPPSGVPFSNMNGERFYLTNSAEPGKTLTLVFFGRRS